VQNRNINLFNFIGENTYPRLKLILSENNGPKWKSFTIDNQQSGLVPWNNDPTCQWSPWNIIDEAGNYYGTINLSCDGQTAKFTGYTKSGTDYSMVRPSLEWNASGQFLSPQDIANIASWGSNVIRLDLNQNYWFASDSADIKGSYKQIILDSAVRTS